MASEFNLDKHQALEAMKKGFKVHRKNWASPEFLEFKDGQMYEENGKKINVSFLNAHYSGWGIKND